VIDVLFILVGLTLLYFGGEAVVRGAIGLSLKAGMSRLLIGLTVMAFSTSSPELFVCVNAALEGNSGIALGNAVGSNIANIGLILGISAMLYPLSVQRSVVRQEIPVLLIASLAVVWFLDDGIIDVWNGCLLLGGLLVYIFISFLYSRKDPNPESSEIEEYTTTQHTGWGRDLLILLAGLGGLILGSECMVHGAVNIANTFGISQAVIGLTIVSIGTSLPELATCVVAAIRKEADIIIGNLIGSNVFNIGAILGCTSIISPLPNDGITALDLTIMVFLSIILLPIMLTGFRICRQEGALLILFYALYIVYLIFRCPPL
jgi:cation:H+ antiporter